MCINSSGWGRQEWGGPLPVFGGVSGCPGWSPAPDGKPAALCSCPEPPASSAPPLTADRRLTSATTHRSPAGGGVESY